MMGARVPAARSVPLAAQVPRRARELLSVQVHPSDGQTAYLPDGDTGKTEAWVVLGAGAASRVYAGLRPGTTAESLRAAVNNGALADHLASFVPKAGDAIFLPAGTVHTVGGGAVVFEVSENSDVTFRLYDWGHVDAETGQRARAPSRPGHRLHRLWPGCPAPGGAGGGGDDPRGTRAALRLRAFPPVAQPWGGRPSVSAPPARCACSCAPRGRG